MCLYRMRAHGGYHCDVCGSSVAAVQLCMLQEKYCRHQNTQRTGTRPVAANPAREAGPCPLSCVEQTVFPSHFHWQQLRAIPIMKIAVNYIQDVNTKVSKCWINHHTMWYIRSGELAPSINFGVKMEVRGQFHAPANLPQGKGPLYPTVLPDNYGCVPQNIIRDIWQHEL
jgi:hypothetical protein